MCVECWERQGSPTFWNERVAETVQAIGELYLMEPVGGPLHSVVDDWNLDGFIEPYPVEAYDPDQQAEVDELCTRIAGMLNGLSMDERHSALAFHDGYATPPVRTFDPEIKSS